ncbi:hypothetical protein EDB83DRAFT_2680206 [Lactarius deliciosus]|nr:hypothetical protein EDB83DRAFT_2680206 [Lactarius deliciosus]
MPYERVLQPPINNATASPPSPRQIVLESLLALFLGIIGACVKAPILEEITSNEMKTSIGPGRSKIWTRMCFANFVTTGRVLG